MELRKKMSRNTTMEPEVGLRLVYSMSPIHSLLWMWSVLGFYMGEFPFIAQMDCC